MNRLKIQMLVICFISTSTLPMQQQQQGSLFGALTGLLVKTLGIIGGSHALWKLTKKYVKQTNNDDDATEFEIEIEDAIPVNSDQDGATNSVDLVSGFASLQRQYADLSDQLNTTKEHVAALQRSQQMHASSVATLVGRLEEVEKDRVSCLVLQERDKNIQKNLYEQSCVLNGYDQQIAKQAEEMSGMKTLQAELQNGLRAHADSIGRQEKQLEQLYVCKESVELVMNRYALLDSQLQAMHVMVQQKDVEHAQLQKDYKTMYEFINHLQQSNMQVAHHASVVDVHASIVLPHESIQRDSSQSPTAGDRLSPVSSEQHHHEDGFPGLLHESSVGNFLTLNGSQTIKKVDSQHFSDDQ